MTKEQIEWIKSLDKQGVDGTIQSILMRNDLSVIPFESALKFMVEALKSEKDFLVKDNVEVSRRINFE